MEAKLIDYESILASVEKTKAKYLNTYGEPESKLVIIMHPHTVDLISEIFRKHHQEVFELDRVIQICGMNIMEISDDDRVRENDALIMPLLEFYKWRKL